MSDITDSTNQKDAQGTQNATSARKTRKGTKGKAKGKDATKGKEIASSSNASNTPVDPYAGPVVTVTTWYDSKGNVVNGEYLVAQKTNGADKQRQCFAVMAVLAERYGYVTQANGNMRDAIQALVYGANGARNASYIGKVLDHMGQGVLRSTGKGNIKGTRKEISRAYPKGVLCRVPHKLGDEKYVASNAEAYASKAVQQCIDTARIPAKVSNL